MKKFIFFGLLSLAFLGAAVLKINTTDKPGEKSVYGFVISNKTQEASKTGIGCNIEVKIGDQEPFLLTPDQKDASVGSFKFVETKGQDPVKITWIEKYVIDPSKKAVMCENGFQHTIQEFKPRQLSKKQIEEISTATNKDKNVLDLDLVIFNDGAYLDKRDKNNKEQHAMPKPIVELKDFQGYFTIPNLNDIPKEKRDKMLQFAIITMRDKAKEAHLSVAEKIIFDYLIEKFFNGKSWVEDAKPNPKG